MNLLTRARMELTRPGRDLAEASAIDQALKDAWTTFYRKTTPITFGNNDPYGYACVTIKEELVYNGFGTNVIVDKQYIGSAADKQIRAFQASQDLSADGVVGPTTARALFRKRAHSAQTQYGIPNDLVCKIKSLESGNDPGAVGYVDPDDHGLVQINLHYHPDITLEQATLASFSLPWAAQSIRSSYNSLRDWDAAVASWNVGSYYAYKWLMAGKPASGGTILSNGKDVYTLCNQYVTLVKSQTC